MAQVLLDKQLMNLCKDLLKFSLTAFVLSVAVSFPVSAAVSDPKQTCTEYECDNNGRCIQIQLPCDVEEPRVSAPHVTSQTVSPVPLPRKIIVPNERMAVAVVEFRMFGGLHEQSGAVIADLMTASIADSGRFTLRDRLPLSTIAESDTSLINQKIAADLSQRYGLDAVVTGSISKLGGELITVNAFLIDTKTASTIRSGQIQGNNIDIIQFKIKDLATMLITPILP